VEKLKILRWRMQKEFAKDHPKSRLLIQPGYGRSEASACVLRTT